MSKKLLGPQVEAEARFGYRNVPHAQGQVGGQHRVGPLGDVGEGSAVDQRRPALAGLHQIRQQGVLQQGRRGVLDSKVRDQEGAAVGPLAQQDSADTLLELSVARGQAEYGHDLAGGGNVEAVLPGRPVLLPQPDDDVPQGPVVHIHHPLPVAAARGRRAGRVEVHGIIQARGNQVVGGGDGVQVPVEVKIDVVRRVHHGSPAAGGPAFDAEHRAQAGFPKSYHRVRADVPQALGKADAGGGFSFAGRGGGDGADQDQLSRGLLHDPLDRPEGYFRLVGSVVKQVLAFESHGPGYLFNRFQILFIHADSCNSPYLRTISA
jgi:hypothetical protein